MSCTEPAVMSPHQKECGFAKIRLWTMQPFKLCLNVQAGMYDPPAGRQPTSYEGVVEPVRLAAQTRK